VALAYIKDNLAVTSAWARADKNFAPRLGFVPEVDYAGPQTEIDYSRNYNHGTISDWSGSVFGLSYDHADGSFYRKEFFTTLGATVRPGIHFEAASDLADFEGSKDSLYTLRASFPRGNPYNNLSLRYDTGRQAGLQYRSITASSAYRVMRKLQLLLRHQHVDYDGPSDQTIFSLSYDLGRDRAIAGRLVRQGSDTNAYVAYQRSGNAGAEYFLILGDPNAPTFRTSLILKVVFPFTWGKKGLDFGASR
jgi:hypothetical protein